MGLGSEPADLDYAVAEWAGEAGDGGGAEHNPGDAERLEAVGADVIRLRGETLLGGNALLPELGE
jgi:hypothetical protein